MNFFKVTYDVNGFCERNRDVLFKDLIELMQTSEKLVLFLSMLLTLQLIDVCMNLILICLSYNWIKPCCLFLLTALSSVICSLKMLTLKKEVDPQQQETKLRSVKQSPTPPCSSILLNVIITQKKKFVFFAFLRCSFFTWHFTTF